MFGESEYKSRVNTAETNSLNVKANICRDVGLQPLHVSRIIVMEHGHVFSWQRQGEENRRERQRDRAGWQEVAPQTTTDGWSCSSWGTDPGNVSPPLSPRLRLCCKRGTTRWSRPGAICKVEIHISKLGKTSCQVEEQRQQGEQRL